MTFRKPTILSICFVLSLTVAASRMLSAQEALPRVQPVLKLEIPPPGDQDDLCFWRHPDNPARSLVITSDKKGERITVFQLDGTPVEMIPTGQPGNIDLRQNVMWNGERVDLLVWNQRKPDFRIRVARIDRRTGELTIIDRGGIPSESNYGGTLYLDPMSGHLHAILTSFDSGFLTAYHIKPTATGEATGELVKKWKCSQSEAAVADEDLGMIYVAEELQGVRKFRFDSPEEGVLILKVGEHGLASDLEGTAVVKTGATTGYLVVSSQGNSTFRIFDRQAPHPFLGAFTVEGASDTDGIDVFPVAAGEQFPAGIFGCHTDEGDRPLLLVSWEEVLRATGLEKGK